MVVARAARGRSSARPRRRRRWRPSSATSSGALAATSRDRLRVVVGGEHVQRVAVLDHVSRRRQLPDAEPGDAAPTRAPVAASNSASVWPTQPSCGVTCSSDDRAGRVAPRLGGRLAEHALEQPAGRPRHGRDGRDAEPLVDLGPLRVVDAGDDVLDAEGLAGDPRGDDVGVVAAADRGERVGLLDAGLDQGLAVEADARSPAGRGSLAEAAEGERVLVDDGDGVRRARPAAGRGTSRPGRSP